MDQAVTRKRLINFKVNEDEYDRIEQLARQHTRGNISTWLRRRGMTVSPFPAGFVVLEESDVDDEDDELEDAVPEVRTILRKR